MEAIKYSRFRLWPIDTTDLDAAPFEAFPFVDGAQSRMVGIGINEPACLVVLEDFVPGPDLLWTVWQDQIDVVLQGRAEITYWEPPDQSEPTTVLAEAPCIYLIPRGTRIVWRVLGDDPFRHISIDFPNPGFTVHSPMSSNDVVRDVR
jgi:ethanolamine utilization protein EutQ (cupin superfamily)